MAILITDGPPSTAISSVLSEATAAYRAGITILTIGVSSLVNQTELALISSMPRFINHQWWYVSNTGSLATIQSVVAEDVCRPEYSTLSAQYCVYTVGYKTCHFYFLITVHYTNYNNCFAIGFSSELRTKVELITPTISMLS